MKTYLRILQYAKPYWKHLSLSVVFTILFAVFNGASVYLTIPLLDILFQEGERKEIVEQPSAVERAAGVLPGWVKDIQQGISDTFNSFVFSGDKLDALMKICILVLFAFLAKNILGIIKGVTGFSQ